VLFHSCKFPPIYDRYCTRHSTSTHLDKVETHFFSPHNSHSRGRSTLSSMSSDLSARLKNLLLVDQSSSEPPQKNDALIEISKKSKQQKEEEPPPPLHYFSHGSTASASISSTQSSSQRFSSTTTNYSLQTAAPSLAEQMMATASSVQKSQEQKQRNEQQKRVKNATFGMKKGFLMKDKPRKKVTSSSTEKNVKEVNTDTTRSGAIQKVSSRRM
jgi:hypothetical protein